MSAEKSDSLKKAFILLAGGSGSRMGAFVQDKVLEPLAGKPVLAYSYEACVASSLFERCIVVYRDEEQRLKIEAALDTQQMSTEFVQGGATRQASVMAGMEVLGGDVDLVFVHDGARPMLSVGMLERLDAGLKEHSAAVLAEPVKDTIHQQAEDGLVQLLDRRTLWAAQTPQAFDLALLQRAYAYTKGATDECSAVAQLGHPVTFVDPQAANPKLTRPEDFAYIEFLMKKRR